MHVDIGGKRWEVVRKSMRGKHAGHCDPPDTPGRKIIVDRKLTGVDELDVHLHEFLHAACFDWLDEGFVECVATEIAAALWKVGYRKEAE